MTNPGTVRTDPEAWAAAQVEEVARELAQKPKRKRAAPPKVRGVFFVPNPRGQVTDHQGRAGDWWIRWTDSATGKKHREKAGSRPAALDLYSRRRAEVRMGQHFPETMRKLRTLTVQTIVADYTAALALDRRDPRKQAETRLAEVVRILGAVDPQGIGPADIERLKARLAETPARGRKDPEDPSKGRPRTPASVNRYLQDLRAAFNLAKRNGKVDRNPVADVRLLRENNKRVREMTGDEETAILAALDPSTHRTKAGRQDRRFRTDLRPLVRFLVATGLRLGEACNLRWADVDWRAEVATLTKTKAGKVQHAPLSAEALGILRALTPEGDSTEAKGDGYVFTWEDGRPWVPAYATHAFRDAAEAAGVKDLHVHDLRHTFACRRLRGGVDIYTVSKLLRHASVVMSERYAHLSAADLRAAVERSATQQKSTPSSTCGEAPA
jgi:integrase